MTKRPVFLKLLLLVLIAFAVGGGSIQTALADDERFISSDGTCGDDMTWELDNREDEGIFTITGSGKFILSDSDKQMLALYGSYVKTVYFPKGMNDMDTHSSNIVSAFKNVTAYIVEEGNENYVSVDGVLYTKDMKELLAYPKGRKETSFIMPDIVENIHNGAFDGCPLENITLSKNLKTIGPSAFRGTRLSSITLPGSVSQIYGAAFANCELLTEILIDGQSWTYYSVDGVLYKKYKTDSTRGFELECYPAGKTDKEYQVPSGVTKIGGYSVITTKYLQTIKLPATVAEIELEAFGYGENSIQNYYIPSTAVCGFNIIENRDGIVIYGKAGSDAQRYAKEKGITFKEAKDPAYEAPVYPFALDEYGNVIAPPSKEAGQERLKLSATSLVLQVKQSTTALYVSEMAYNDTVVKWESSNKKVTVNAATGELEAKKAGSATITVTMASGAQASCKVKVQNDAVKVKKLALSKTKVTLQKGKSYTLTVKKTPITSLEKLTFTSSDTTIATVSKSGVIKAKKKGTVTITVESESGVKQTCTVTVK